MTADALVEIFKARGCQPLTQCDAHELRDAVHETVHVLQCGSKTYEREALNEKLCKAAKNAARRWKPLLNETTMLVRYELEARAVEMLACQRFGIEYDLQHWALIMWLETSRTLRVDIGKLEDVEEAILLTSKRKSTQRMLERVLALKAPRKRKASRDRQAASSL